MHPCKVSDHPHPYKVHATGVFEMVEIFKTNGVGHQWCRSPMVEVINGGGYQWCRSSNVGVYVFLSPILFVAVNLV